MSPQDKDNDGPNRREYERQLVCIPAYAHTIDSDERVALIRDISLSGARFLTRTAFEPGDRISVTLHLTGDPHGPVHELTADVIRVEERDPEEAGIWPFAVAVQFDVVLTQIAREIDQLAELLAERSPD